MPEMLHASPMLDPDHDLPDWQDFDLGDGAETVRFAECANCRTEIVQRWEHRWAHHPSAAWFCREARE
jgi:hypothetical protein